MKTIPRWLLAAAAAAAVWPACARAETKDVVVLGTGGRVLEAQAGAEELRLLAPADKLWMIRGLTQGDAVQVVYDKDGEANVLTGVQGEGTVTGTVVEVGNVMIKVKADDGGIHRLMPCWTGGLPKDGGGHDKAVLKQIRAAGAGDRVRMTWKLEEGKRVTGVTPLAQAAE